MIETYKIVTGKYDPVIAPTLSRSVSYTVMSKINFKTIQNQNHFQKMIVKSKSKSQHDKRFKIEIASEVILNHKIKIIGHKL